MIQQLSRWLWGKEEHEAVPFETKNTSAMKWNNSSRMSRSTCCRTLSCKIEPNHTFTDKLPAFGSFFACFCKRSPLCYNQIKENNRRDHLGGIYGKMAAYLHPPRFDSVVLRHQSRARIGHSRIPLREPGEFVLARLVRGRAYRKTTAAGRNLAAVGLQLRHYRSRHAPYPLLF